MGHLFLLLPMQNCKELSWKSRLKQNYVLCRLEQCCAEKHLPHNRLCSHVGMVFQRGSNGSSSREQTEGRLLQSKIVGIDGRCGEMFFRHHRPASTRICASKQQPTIDNSAEAQHAERVPLSNETSDLFGSLVKCNIVSDYRTLIDDLWRIIEFADWLHDEALEISPSAEKVYSVNCEQDEGL